MFPSTSSPPMVTTNLYMYRETYRKKIFSGGDEVEGNFIVDLSTYTCIEKLIEKNYSLEVMR